MNTTTDRPEALIIEYVRSLSKMLTGRAGRVGGPFANYKGLKDESGVVLVLARLERSTDPVFCPGWKVIRVDEGVDVRRQIKEANGSAPAGDRSYVVAYMGERFRKDLAERLREEYGLPESTH